MEDTPDSVSVPLFLIQKHCDYINTSCTGHTCMFVCHFYKNNASNTLVHQFETSSFILRITNYEVNHTVRVELKANNKQKAQNHRFRIKDEVPPFCLPLVIIKLVG